MNVNLYKIIVYPVFYVSIHTCNCNIRSLGHQYALLCTIKYIYIYELNEFCHYCTVLIMESLCHALMHSKLISRFL